MYRLTLLWLTISFVTYVLGRHHERRKWLVASTVILKSTTTDIDDTKS